MYACIHIPNFLVQAILRAEPALRAEAVAITDGKPPLCRVVALNNKAARAGVKPGISKLEAAQFPEVTIRQRSPAQEQGAHAALLDLGFAFSPRVEATAPDTVVLDLAGLEHLFGVPETIASNLKRGASALRLKANVAVAANVDAAVHAGRWLRGVSVIPEGKEPELLGSLPLEVLAPQLEILETLDRWGVRTFRALAVLPSAQLSQRLGQEGLRLQALARGRTSRPLVPVEPALKFEEAAELEYPVTLLEPLAFILGRMLDQLSKRLEARSLATHELRLTLELENQGSVTCELSIAEDKGQSTTDNGLRTSDSGAGTGGELARTKYEKTLRLPLPTRNSKLLLKLWLLHLKADPPQAPVLKVVLFAEPATPRVAQGGLFLPPSPDPEKLEVTLTRIAGVVGKERVGSPELEDSYRPGAFRISRFNPEDVHSRAQGRGRRAAVRSQLSVPESVKRPNSMALRIFRPARPATVELVAGRPVRIFAVDVHGDVVGVSGPWRTSGNWWRHDAWGEDEWEIELWSPVLGPSLVDRNLSMSSSLGQQTGNGRRTSFYRIYRDLVSGNWFIRGTYD